MPNGPTWRLGLARHPVRWTRPYLAEATCDPAAAR